MSKNRHLTWLVCGAASALLLGACVAQEGEEEVPGGAGEVTIDGAQDPVAGDVTAKLSVDRTSASASDRVVVTMTLTNNAAHPIKLLGWYAPDEELEENLFEVSLDGANVEYTGPHYKRPAPAESDFVTLPGGKSISRVVDITDFYDLSKTGDYQVKYAASVRANGAKDSALVQSNPVKMWIEARPSGVTEPVFIKAPGPSNITGGISYSKCTVTQQGELVTALNAASSMANGASAYINGVSSATPRYTKWFGAFDNTRLNLVKNHYTAIKDVYDTKTVNIDCGCKKTYYAYVYPNQPYNIYVCKAFWAAPVTGTDSRGGTLIHETSHFTATAGTDDWAYGQSAASSLAVSDPNKAVDNADSHEYFAENTPVLQ